MGYLFTTALHDDLTSFTNNLTVSVQYIFEKLSFPLGREPQMTTSGSNFDPIANGDLMYVHVYLKHFPLVNMRFFSHKDFRRAPAGISRVDISAPLAQTRKRRHRGEEACSAGASQSPDRAAGRRSTHLHTQPAHKMREEAPSPASTSERPWPSQLSGPRGCSVRSSPVSQAL